METKSQVLKSGNFITRCELNNAWQSKEPLNESRLPHKTSSLVVFIY